MRMAAGVLLVGILMAGEVRAQGAMGSIAGTVHDSSGAVVPGAKVTVTNEATGIAQTVITQNNGADLAPPPAPGDQPPTHTAPGFKQLDISGLKVDVGSTLTEDATLEVGQVTETVRVEAQSSLVDPTSGQVGTTIQTSYVLEMPLADRNVFTLVNLVPGAFYRGSDISLGGGRTRSAQILIDGVTSSRGGVAAQQL